MFNAGVANRLHSVDALMLFTLTYWQNERKHSRFTSFLSADWHSMPSLSSQAVVRETFQHHGQRL